jgi:long-chain acyl-CoA synthetase
MLEGAMEREWVRFYEPGVPAEVEVPEGPLDELVRAAAARWPSRNAVVFSVNAKLPAGRVSFGSLDDMVSRFASALQQLDVQKGDRVALMLPNSIQFVVAFFGALRAGAVVVATNPLYVAREMRDQWNDAGVETVVLLANFLPRLREVQGETAVRRVIVTQVEDTLPAPTRWLVPLVQRKHKERVAVRPAPDLHLFDDLLKRHSAKTLRHVEIQPDELALLQYTGGTTGVPKGAMLSHRNLRANVAQIKVFFRSAVPGEEVFIGALPFFHVYGLTVGLLFSAAIGGTMVAIPRPLPVDVVMETIARYRCSIFPGVPALYAGIVNHRKVQRLDLRSIKACLSGAAPLPVAVQESFENLTGGKLVEGYGLSETSPVTHANPIDGKRVAGSIGLPVSSTDAKVIALEGEQECTVDQEGELAVKGPQVMSGYWRKPEENRQAFTSDGFFRTGDIARRDADGFFFIVDRKKDLINAAGFKVVPREVEEVLYRHPAVAEAVVIGAPDPVRGEHVKAFVVLKVGQELGETEVIEYCKRHLAPYKVPRAVEFRAELPKTAVGKTLRRVLVAEEKAKTEQQPESDLAKV